MTPPAERTPDGATYAAFAGAVVIGGINFIAVSYSNMELPPLFGAMLRFALAGALFVVIARAARVPLPGRRLASGAALYGVLGFGVSYALMYYALVGLAAGTVAVIMAAAPLFTLIIAVLLRQERLSLRGVVGGLLAIAGIGVLSPGAIGGEVGAAYLVAAIVGTVAVAASSVVARALREVHPLNMNAIGMMAGTLLLAAGSLAVGESWALPRASATWWAVAYLVVVGSVGLFQCFLYVVRRWSASATIYAVTGMPVVAVLLGAVMLGQPITPEVVVGGALVIAAVYVGAISRSRQAIRIEPLSAHPEALPALRAWFEAEWPAWYGAEGPGSAEDDLRAFAEGDGLPFGVVALRGGEIVGVGALKADSIESHRHLTPWAAAGLVRPDLRGQGIGALLLEALARRARELGFTRIHCGTSTSAGLLQRGGWVLEETVEHDGQPLGIYTRELGR